MAKQDSAFKCHLPFAVKMRAWQAHGQASAAYSGQMLHLNRERLLGCKRWETVQVRRPLCIKPRKDEGLRGYGIRSSSTVCQAFSDAGLPWLHHRILRGALKEALQ